VIIIIIICKFIRRTMSARRLNLRRQQSLGGDDGAVNWLSKKLKEQKPFEEHFESVISRGKSNFKK